MHLSTLPGSSAQGQGHAQCGCSRAGAATFQRRIAVWAKGKAPIWHSAHLHGDLAGDLRRELGGVEVGQDSAAVVGDQQVIRLDVAVDHTGRVQVRHRREGVERQRDAAAHRQHRGRVVQEAEERATGEEREDQSVGRGRVNDSDRPDHALVRHRTEQLQLALESLDVPLTGDLGPLDDGERPTVGQRRGVDIGGAARVQRIDPR
eukprot:scaffold13141_cov105-Isochrysis_galbana.AAC.4